jgi:hypothetical protein
MDILASAADAVQQAAPQKPHDAVTESAKRSAKRITRHYRHGAGRSLPHRTLGKPGGERVRIPVAASQNFTLISLPTSFSPKGM